MSEFEVPTPILNSPFEEPGRHWYIQEGESPELRSGRRPAIVFPPQEQTQAWDLSDGTLAASSEYPGGFELLLVSRVRERLKAWREQGYPGATRTSLHLLAWWRRDGRQARLFFAQLEAAETTIFLREARPDFLQGINVPRETVSREKQADGVKGFVRHACKMATGSGKTTVMGMLSAWSILNKVHNRGDGRFSDVVLVVCPNVTIRERLRELDPLSGEASIYYTRDLVPPEMRPDLAKGRVLVTNWHVFEPRAMQTAGVSARVSKAGVAVRTRENISIGPKTTVARDKRYLTLEDYTRQVANGLLTVIEEHRDKHGDLQKATVESVRYVESDTALVNRVLGHEVGGKQNILVMNDEAHHAYRIQRTDEGEEEEDLFGEKEQAEEFFKEATVWVEGLDRINKLRGINFCLDLSATPYYLGRAGKDANRPFPWVVSDFGLIDAIESGLTKIPQLAVRDTTGAEIPGYFNIWQWILPQLTAAERGGKRGSPKPEAILKYAHHPIAMLGGLWQEILDQRTNSSEDPRPPVFILVCKNTAIAKVLYQWLAEDKPPTGISPVKIPGFRNRNGETNTIRVDSKVIAETDDLEGAKNDESRWMRFTLDTVGKPDWPRDRQGRQLFPEKFQELANKLKRPLHPPGRDVRCIVSVGMLTEGWDCNTVTHIVGLRPFMSQLLCEQVVGRGLRRSSYDIGEDGLFAEEVALVFGVPFRVIPFKASSKGTRTPPPKRHHIHPLPSKEPLAITFPRVEGYTLAVRNRVTVDWASVPKLVLEPGRIPPEVEVKGLNLNNKGRLSLTGPGRVDDVTLADFRAKRRFQELVFTLAQALARDFIAQGRCEVPAHVLFPQVASIVTRYLHEKVAVQPPADIKDLFLSPYYGWVIERLLEAIRPDTSQGEAPEVPRYEAHRGVGSTADVDYWTSRDVREVQKSHLNFVVLDTKRWEQTAAYYIDKHEAVDAFVKNAGLGFAIPYFHNGDRHDYVPDFLIRLKTNPPCHLILETKGYDPLKEVKTAAAVRWVNAVNADGVNGYWRYEITADMNNIPSLLDSTARDAPAAGYCTVDVFFATDRIPTQAPEHYGTTRAPNVHLGLCTVSIPDVHRIGKLERPSVWRFEFSENPKKHVTIQNLREEPEDAFLATLASHLEATTGHEVFVFVHGFNVTFGDAVMRTAQIAYDLKLDGAPVTYSWPSQGSLMPLAYTTDEQAAEATIPHLEWFLRTLATRTGARTLYLLAHSMGSRPLSAALKGIVLSNAVSTPRDVFKETILAAPDIDKDVFVKQIAPALAQATKRVTLYASAKDSALGASQKIHGYPRAGDAAVDVVSLPSVDAIDASAVDTSLLGHSYFATERSVVSDIHSIVRNGLPPGKRFGMTGVPPTNPKYWVFNP